MKRFFTYHIQKAMCHPITAAPIHHHFSPQRLKFLNINSNSHLLSDIVFSVWVSPCKYLCQGEKGETGKPGRDGSAGVKVL